MFAEWSKYDSVIFFYSPLCRHPVWPDGGSVFAELDMCLYDPCLCVCRQLLAFNPAVHRTASGKGKMYSLPPYFRLILTFSYVLYQFLRELELGTVRSPDTDEVDSFHGQIRWAKLKDFAPDIHDAMELWALRPQARLVKVISVCRLHVFFHQYVADLREERSENVLRRVSALAFLLDMTVMSSSGVIVSPSHVPVGQIQPLTAVVSSTDAGSTVTPFVVPPPPDIEQPCRQLHDFLTYRTPESRQSSFWLSLSASSTLTLPRNPAKFSSSSFSLDRYPPLRGNKSPPAREALLPQPADDCLFPGMNDPNTAGWCEPFPGSEYPSSLPACATVRAVLSAGPSGAPNWVGCQDIYDTAREITYLFNCHIFVRPLRCDDFPIRRIRRDDTSSPHYAQILGVRRSAVFRWKPGIRIAASSYSALRQRRMSGVVPSPVLACRSRLDSDYCSCPLELDDYPYDLMMEFVGGWCLALTLHAGG